MTKKAEEKNVERVGLPVNKKLKEDLTELAYRNRMPLAKFVRSILEEYIKAHPLD